NEKYKQDKTTSSIIVNAGGLSGLKKEERINAISWMCIQVIYINTDNR
ncbi:23868_t:CDS:2, partial [Cetraspora pellucida]